MGNDCSIYIQCFELIIKSLCLVMVFFHIISSYVFVKFGIRKPKLAYQIWMPWWRWREKTSRATFIGLQFPWFSHCFLFVLVREIATTEPRIVLDYVSRILRWTILKLFCHCTAHYPGKRNTYIFFCSTWLVYEYPVCENWKIRKGCGEEESKYLQENTVE